MSKKTRKSPGRGSRGKPKWGRGSLAIISALGAMVIGFLVAVFIFSGEMSESETETNPQPIAEERMDPGVNAQEYKTSEWTQCRVSSGNFIREVSGRGIDCDGALAVAEAAFSSATDAPGGTQTPEGVFECMGGSEDEFGLVTVNCEDEQGRAVMYRWTT